MNQIQNLHWVEQVGSSLAALERLKKQKMKYLFTVSCEYIHMYFNANKIHINYTNLTLFKL